jgi:hypothetical protein
MMTGILVLLFWSCTGQSFALESEAGKPPFQTGERLTFQIRWGFIPAGEAILEVSQDTVDNHDVHHFILTVKTFPVIDIFYKFRERVDSFTDMTLSKTLLYKKVQSSNHARDIRVDFDWQISKAQYSNFGTPIEPIDLQPGTLDPLAALYYIRQQITGPDFELERPVTDGKEVVMGKVHYVARETISINGKKYDTIKLEPEMKGVKGVFEKSKNAKMYIWLTNDARKLLVKLKSKVVVGSFTAELVEDRKNLDQKTVDTTL